MSFQAIFKNTRLWTFICGLFLFSSCRYSKTPEVFEDKNISIEYPSYLFKAEDVYPEKNTLLQLKNDYRDVYFILVDHGMKPGVQGFELMCDSVINQLKRNLKEPNVEAKDTLFTTANNLKVKEFQISGILSSEKQDHRFYFVVDVMEGPNGHIYQTAGWLLRHKRDLWLKDLQKSAYSLKVK
jgi:hypothetical protein